MQRQAPSPASVRVRDIVYANDHVACVVSRTADRLERAVAHVMGCLLAWISSHGLSANFGPTKTAALLVHRGSGAKKARDRHFCQSKAEIPVLREHSCPVMLDAVPAYRHRIARAMADSSSWRRIG